jgi:hypothetical protein
MFIPDRSDINLGSPEVFSFARDQSRTKFDAVLPVHLNYSPSGAAKKTAGEIVETSPKMPLKINWAVQEFYGLYEGRHAVGAFDVIVSYGQPVTLQIYSFLQLRNATSADSKKKIDDAFIEFQFPRDGDPNDYVRARLAADPSIAADDFLIETTWSLIKTDPLIIQEDQKKAILAIYDGNGNGNIFPGPHTPGASLGGEDGYFKQKNIRALKLREVVLDSIPAKVPDPLHEVESVDPDDAMHKAAVKEGNAIECGGKDFEEKHWKIANLVNYPEFRTGWHDVRIKVGCTIIVLTLPVTETRHSELSLWAYARYPNNVGKYVETVVEDCVWFAALSAAVIGVALASFNAALIAFRGIFVECIKNKLNQTLDCMMPGLLLLSEPTDDWH